MLKKQFESVENFIAVHAPGSLIWDDWNSIKKKLVDGQKPTTNTVSAEILDRANVCEYCVHLGKLIDDEANECSSCSGGYSRFLGRELRT